MTQGQIYYAKLYTEDEVQKFRSELELLQTPIAFLDVLPENTHLVKNIDTLPPTPRSSQTRVQAAIQKKGTTNIFV